MKLPFSGTPNNALYPCWGDLNPGVGGAVYVGSTGSAPNRVEVISWVGVPHFETSSVTYTFQVLLYETSNEIVFQYQEIQPTNASYGAGNAVTIGIENSAGTIARQYGFNGSQPVTNNQAILFTLTPPAPVLNPPASPATNLLITITGNTMPLASVALFTNTCAVQLATGTADEAGTFAFSVPVQTNSTTTFTALAVDIAGNTSACSSAVSYIHLDPATDADGDGFTNLDELNAGTPPLDPASYPYATLFLDGTVQISSVSGKTYRLQRCDDLPGGDWTNVGAPQTGDGSPLTFPDVAGVPQRFYRVKISP